MSAYASPALPLEPAQRFGFGAGAAYRPRHAASHGRYASETLPISVVRHRMANRGDGLLVVARLGQDLADESRVLGVELGAAERARRRLTTRQRRALDG